MYLYIKSLHIIFVVTWFAGLFYIVRLFIYNREAQHKPEAERKILQQQFSVMIKRLWFGIAWPSCILTIIFGAWMLVLFGSIPVWLWIKIGFVAGLFAYHLSLHFIYRQQASHIFNYTSNQLRIWNEVATIFLFAIVMLVVVKEGLSLVWSIGGLLLFAIMLMVSIMWYKKIRKR